MITVLFINNSGGGFADYVTIEPNVSVGEFFISHMGGNPADFMIRVNRQPVARDYVLKEGDRITITPTKIDGA